MLRRAAPLVRTLRSTTTVAQSSSAASSGDNVAARGAGRDRRREDKRPGGQRRGNRIDFKPQFVDEHHQLFKKHGQAIENTEVESLTDAIERINWYSSVSNGTLKKVSQMMKKSSLEELNSMSDRAMATLFSAFGEMNREMKRDDKRKLIEETVKDITDKGYSLGPFTRAAIFTAKVDMAQTVEELPSVVDELSTWESADIALTEDMVVQAARVYAIQGDRKGVIELTNYARESFGRVEVRFVEWIALSMISCGEGNGVAAIEKLARSSPDSSTRLWLSGALGAAYKSDLQTVVECLSRVPLAAKMQNPMQNGPVADLFVHLVERGVEGVEHSLGAYLALSGDGASLYEKHSSNIVLAFKARRAVNEGKMEVATRLYALVHGSQRNYSVESELKKGVNDMGNKGESSVEEVKRCVSRLHQSGVIEDINSFLLSALRGERLIEFIQQLRSSGQLTDAVSKCPINKFALMKQLREHPSCTPLSVTASATAIIMADGYGKTGQEREDYDRQIFKTAKEDPDVVVQVVEELRKSNMADAEFLAGCIINAALSRILWEKDVLSSGRIEKILNSPYIVVSRLYYMDRRLVQMIRMAKEGTDKERATDIAANVIIGAFKNEGVKYPEMQVLIRIMENTDIREDTLEMLVNKLAKNPCVGIGMVEMEKALKSLEQRGLTKRMQLLEMLRRKSQTASRWMSSPPEILEAELETLSKKKEVKDGVVCYITTILMNKLMETPASTDRLISLLDRVIPTLNKKTERKTIEGGEGDEAWENIRRVRMRESTEKVYGKAMKQSVMEGDWTAAQRLWSGRGSINSLPIAPCLALSFHELRGGSKELSDEIISTIRNTGQSVREADLSQLGDLLRDLSMDELATASEWLTKELRLEAVHVARIKAAKVRRGIEDLINSGRLQEAFDVMKETSELSKNAIGHFDVLRAAIRSEKKDILEATVNMVSSLHSRPTAILDLAYSFLMENKGHYAEQLLKTPTIKLSPAKIDFYIKNATNEKRMDVIHSLFSILVACPVTDEKISNSTLNYLALTTLRSYVKSDNSEATRGLVEEIDRSTLVVEKQLQELIDRVKKTVRSSSV